MTANFGKGVSEEMVVKEPISATQITKQVDQEDSADPNAIIFSSLMLAIPNGYKNEISPVQDIREGPDD